MKVTARTAASSEAAIYESSDNSGYSITSNNINTSTVIRRVAVSPGATSTNIAYTAYVPPGPVSYLACYLVVAGGGGGGGNNGGGAGGVLTGTVPMIQGCCQYPVYIGAGGANGIAGNGTNGFNGNNSCLGSIAVTCGGGAGYGNNSPGGPVCGCCGGSGGGGCQTIGISNVNNNAIPGQGYHSIGRGGGGAGGTSADCVGTYVCFANGGPGIYSPISGSCTAYGGGGGGFCAPGTSGPGGVGGGGNSAGPVPATNGFPGCQNTGGGGGGDYCLDCIPGCGGSGIVIVAYTAPASIGTGGTLSCYSCTCNGITCCYWVHTFTSSGCYCS